jgi:hypothetical protein
MANTIRLRRGTAAPVASNFVVGEPAWDATNSNLYVKNTAGSMVLINSGSSFTGGTLTNNLTLAAGTTSLSPLTFQSGTNLTSATAGAIEYDGKSIYATTSTSHGRGLVQAANFYRLNADLAGTTATTAQKTFGVGITVAASTVYEFEYLFVLSKASGTTSHSISVNFGGTATINNAMHFVNETSSNTTGLAAALLSATSMSTGLSYNMGTIANVSLTGMGRGTVSINASGTLIPQYTLSANPGAAYSTLAGSYFAIWPIGAAGANTSVGAWA